MISDLAAKNKALLVHSQEIRFVRVQFSDSTNVVRLRVFPISQFKKLTSSNERVVVPFAQGTLGVAYLHLADGFSAQGEYLLAVDFQSLKFLPYKPGYVVLMGWLENKVVPQPENPLKAQLDFCSRTLLNNIVIRAKESGYEFLVGFETEFVLLTSTSPVKTVHGLEAYTSALGLPAGSKAELVLEEISEALEAANIEVQMFHPEAAPGQYEIVTGPLSPLQAADALVHTQQTIYAVASKHGLKATLAPQVCNWSAGSATHVHISIQNTDNTIRPVDSDHPYLNKVEASFLSGLLSSFSALMAFTLPTPASYARVADGMWSGGTWICWGTDNKEAPVRLCNAFTPASRNFEIKMMDGTANPYFALAGIIAAGMEGVNSNASLQIKDCFGASAEDKGEAGRKELGIEHKIPPNLNHARRFLKGSHTFNSAFGENVVTKYLSVNKTMAHALNTAEGDAKLTLLVETY